MDISSGVPNNIQTTDNVTGIATRSDQRISMALDVQVDIFNETGNYSIYAGHIDTRNESAMSGSCSMDVILRATHKTIDGAGNGIYQNDFDSPSLETSIVNIPKTEYYFDLEKSGLVVVDDIATGAPNTGRK